VTVLLFRHSELVFRKFPRKELPENPKVSRGLDLGWFGPFSRSIFLETSGFSRKFPGRTSGNSKGSFSRGLDLVG